MISNTPYPSHNLQSAATEQIPQYQEKLNYTHPSPVGYPSIPDTLISTNTPLVSTPQMIKPRLSLPSHVKSTRLSELYYLKEMETFHSFGDRILNTNAIELDTFRLELQDLIQALTKAAEAAKDPKFWSLLQKTATSLISSLSIVLGTAFIAAGGGAVIGGTMIASGVFSIANMMISEAGVWDLVADKLGRDDEEKKMIAMLIPVVIGIIAGLTGLHSYDAAIIQFDIPILDHILLITQSTLSIINGSTTIGKGYSDAQLVCAKTYLFDIKSLMIIQRQGMDTTIKSITHAFDIIHTAHQQSAQIVALAVRSNQLVTREIRG